MGCTTQVWLDVMMDSDGTMRFLADTTPEEDLGMKTEDLGDLNVAGLHGTNVDFRVNTWKKKEDSKF
ncbi:putative Fe-S metabolism associated domain, SufE [Helianthus anomalus]